MGQQYLPPQNAQTADNVKLQSGEIRGIRQLKPARVFQFDVLKAYRIPDPLGDANGYTWVGFDSRDPVLFRGPLTNDAYDRFYLFGDGPPKYNTLERIRNDDPWYHMGVPTPDQDPSVTPGSGTDTDVDRWYCYTYVTAFGEEGPPSNPVKGTGAPDATWAIGNLDTTPTDASGTHTGSNNAAVLTDSTASWEEDEWVGYTIENTTDGSSATVTANTATTITATLSGGTDNDWDTSDVYILYGLRDITTKRIYRTVVGLTTSEFFLVDEVALATTSYNDTLSDETVARNSPLESTNWTPPPRDIQGAVLLPNGFFVAWSDTDIHFSEPYRPHAWPPIYDLSTEFQILGGGVFGQSAAIVTVANPYIATGVNPAAVTLTKSTTVEPGLSKYGIVSMPYGVLYPSQNGLAMIGPNGIQIVTKTLLTKNEWVNDYSPSSLWAAQFEDAFIGFYSSTSGFIIDPAEPQVGLVDLKNFTNVTFIQTDYYTGDVLITIGDTVYVWDDPSEFREEYRYRSPDFHIPMPVNLGAVKVELQSDEDALIDFNFPYDDLLAWNTERIEYPLAELGGDCLAGNDISIADTELEAMTETLPLAYRAAKLPLGGSPLIELAGDIADMLKVRLNVYAEGELVFSEIVHNTPYMRLPSGFKADHWSFEVIGRKAVYHIIAAETGKGLRDA